MKITYKQLLELFGIVKSVSEIPNDYLIGDNTKRTCARLIQEIYEQQSDEVKDISE